MPPSRNNLIINLRRIAAIIDSALLDEPKHCIDAPKLDPIRYGVEDVDVIDNKNFVVEVQVLMPSAHGHTKASMHKFILNKLES